MRLAESQPFLFWTVTRNARVYFVTFVFWRLVFRLKCGAWLVA